ncbi:hypothetical protein THAOC_35204 [Thalassiosira oceanica]|uniref:Uncharacterized protein n=1 Tax=Thalassiosira oceanica TaxID=159749 RepID=K0R1A0_THAOC|nr:hypothetical protein THAOC_35204 [Thalassiosira oceanica]|eukprot:EJK46143.1 hypothetical protein THAOC_35204 [Thalassiosira oceanica]
MHFPQTTESHFSLSQPGVPGGGSPFQLSYGDSGKCVNWDGNLDLKILNDCSSDSVPQFIYTSDKKLVVQGGDRNGWCVWADGGLFPKLKVCPGPGMVWSGPGQPGSGSTFSIAYADSYNTGSFGGKCVGWNGYLDLEIFFDCSSNSVPRFIYTSDKKIQVQGGDKNGWCVWADRGTYPKLSDCNDSNKLVDMIWTYEGGQLRTRGGTKCLVTWHGTESSHTPSLTAPSLTMRDCESVTPSPTMRLTQELTWDYEDGKLMMTYEKTKCLTPTHNPLDRALRLGDCNVLLGLDRKYSWDFSPSDGLLKNTEGGKCLVLNSDRSLAVSSSCPKYIGPRQVGWTFKSDVCFETPSGVQPAALSTGAIEGTDAYPTVRQPERRRLQAQASQPPRLLVLSSDEVAQLQITSNSNFEYVGNGKCTDSGGNTYSNILLTSFGDSSINATTDSCANWCSSKNGRR